MEPNRTQFWKQKLAALLHDPPHKCLDIARHEEAARAMLSVAGFTEDEIADIRRTGSIVKQSDHFASAAERFVFPKGECATDFDGTAGSSFIHPLSSPPFLAADGSIREKAGLIEDILKSAIGGIDSDDPQVRFFLYWRRWMENAVTSEKKHAQQLAFLPADTRIPDHSIWNHTGVTSALAGCAENGRLRPALLLFQLGPVQDFIAQARSTRDLWSGSYLLSWLMAHAMKAISDRIGPDAIIFPNLRGNGIFDALHREEIYGHKFKSGNRPDQTCWERMLEEKRSAGGKDDPLRAERWLLTPTLPNRFLALVPASEAEALAKAAQEAIHSELKAIGEAVWTWIEKEAKQAKDCKVSADWRLRFDAQIAAFPQAAWAVQPWLEQDACIEAFRKLPVNAGGGEDTPLQRLQDMLAFGEQWLPVNERDDRYYTDKTTKQKLDNPGMLWSAHYALVDAKLAARRNTRDFNAWHDDNARGATKDSLSGKEESIGDEAFWKHLQKLYEKLFKGAHQLGAMNLVKRLWCRDSLVPYLCTRLGIRAQDFGKALGFDSVEEVADKNQYGGPYVALLAMDGDKMGKWVSGKKTPKFLDQLSHNAAEHLRKILTEKGKQDLHRLLTPSYHLQFSEALSNFSTWLAEPIVRAFDGQLIYAGGDDVLAMLPADRAIACAKTLRAVFRGEAPEKHNQLPLAIVQDGFVNESAGYPLIVPGSRADVSIGIAIGHFNAPLQMLVREAQTAEKRAKNRYGRKAIAISVYKRSGEITEWGCKWGSRGLQLMEFMQKYTNTPKDSTETAPISGRFPYALAALLKPYALQGKLPDNMHGVIREEFRHIVQQQGAGLNNDQKAELAELGNAWLEETRDHLEDFINLFLVETFINRQHGEQ